MYKVYCYELDTNSRFTFHWSNEQMQLAQRLVSIGAMTIVNGFGFFYEFNKLKAGMERLSYDQ